MRAMRVAILLGHQFSRVLSLVRNARSFSHTAIPSSYLDQVTNWLDSEKVPWTQVQQNDFPQAKSILSLNDNQLTLHLLLSPTKASDCVPATLTQQMTNACIDGTIHDWTATQIIHLHQDVWNDQQDIVTCRLLAQLGRTPKRIFARNTIAKRMDAPTAKNFLSQHHLWGPTKAKYYYGLFCKKTNELMAVATFSSKRNIIRNGILYKSHELIRYCAQRDGTVVGGISKLLKIFIVNHAPDDIVTLVDRDWGPGSKWHTLGFQTVNIMPPLVMAIMASDGKRRHLVGAGIQLQQGTTTSSSSGRLGLPVHVQEDLNLIQTSKEAAQCLMWNKCFPVYDAGVERLMMIVTKQNEMSPQELWNASVPTYGHSYYSTTSGISALLRDAESVQASSPSWSASSLTGVSKLLHSSPSSLDIHATVQVHERPGGWRTLSLIGGMTKSIYHGVFKVHPDGTVDPTINVVPYIDTMVSIALVGAAGRKKSLSCLHFGLGAGTLQRQIRHYLPDSQHLTIELDTGVVAAMETICPADPNHCILVADALTFTPSRLFDYIFIDVFGADNLLPPDFYSQTNLERLRNDVLEKDGMIIQNFHTGGKNLLCQLAEAEANYAATFEYCFRVDSLDSKPNAGNTILVASTSKILDQEAWTTRNDFSIAWRLRGLKPVLSTPCCRQ